MGAVGILDTADAYTIYSVDGNETAERETHGYISQFADQILARIGHQQSDDKIKILVTRLPELLKAFALKIGQSPSDQDHREVMHFMHKNRR